MTIEEDIKGIFSDDKENEFDINKEILKALERFYDTDNIEIKTEIPLKQLQKLVKLKLYGELIKRYSKKAHTDIEKYLNVLMIYSLSTNRQSRKEFFDAIKNLSNNADSLNNGESEKIKHRFLK